MKKRTKNSIFTKKYNTNLRCDMKFEKEKEIMMKPIEQVKIFYDDASDTSTFYDIDAQNECLFSHKKVCSNKEKLNIF